MRARFTAPGTHICWYELEWNPSSVAWSAFRAEFIGATEPVQAEPGSLRGTILRQWVSLGLASEPSTGENGVHASASPLEGLAEKINWLGVSLAQDPFGKLLINAGISEETIRSWTADPAVYFEGRKQSVFDLLEDLDVEACVDKAKRIVAADLREHVSQAEPDLKSGVLASKAGKRNEAGDGVILAKQDGIIPPDHAAAVGKAQTDSLSEFDMAGNAGAAAKKSTANSLGMESKFAQPHASRQLAAEGSVEKPKGELPPLTGHLATPRQNGELPHLTGHLSTPRQNTQGHTSFKAVRHLPDEEEIFSDAALRDRAQMVLERSTRLMAKNTPSVTDYPKQLGGEQHLRLESLASEAQESFLRVARYEAEAWLRQERQRQQWEIKTAKRQKHLSEQLAQWHEKKRQEEALEQQREEAREREKAEKQRQEIERWKNRDEELKLRLAEWATEREKQEQKQQAEIKAKREEEKQKMKREAAYRKRQKQQLEKWHQQKEEQRQRDEAERRLREQQEEDQQDDELQELKPKPRGRRVNKRAIADRKSMGHDQHTVRPDESVEDDYPVI
eukprot:TRINITY_DN9697_c0_g1_i3.p1 TRINITY_DN9697_c0_g1~~TRINITY_DN9697_c0_g1_i3.p1  ORF type:complete len:573 (-),score=156.74 TRINITY_DN9697_c0_g1_i3:107-1792(-)